MSRLAAVPQPSTPPPAETPERLDNIDEFAVFARLSRSQVERLVDEGLPCLDLAIGNAGRRRKRTLRFERAACMAWLRERSAR